MDKFTDPAHELATFFENLRAHHGASSKRTGEILQSFFDVTSSDAIFHTLVGSVTYRCQYLADIVKNEPKLDRYAGKILNGISKLSSTFSYGNLAEQWQNIINSHITPEYISNLE